MIMCTSGWAALISAMHCRTDGSGSEKVTFPTLAAVKTVSGVIHPRRATL
jgi:hypothetical protein